MILGSTQTHPDLLGPTIGTPVDLPSPLALEDEGFPFEALSEIAELESWRKEINRPIYHIHKWWAQRLGSVFRGIVLGAFSPAGSDVTENFYKPTTLPDPVVFDPFMGSGTTIGEALKLGARAIGRDINPVAAFVVRNALRKHTRQDVLQCFREIEGDLAERLRAYYRITLPSGELAETLYYFWVKFISCPQCQGRVDLFSTYVFVQHAYAAKYPRAHAVCPACDGVNQIDSRLDAVECSVCRRRYDPHTGPARGAKAKCPACDHIFPILAAVRAADGPPHHRLYAKLVLRSDGTKQYLSTDNQDVDLYERASADLRRQHCPHPVVAIGPGYNTNQAINYNYKYWHQMFNDRQLLCLGLLAERIRAIPQPQLRELFTCLFSGTLEFNNMFASFKGEGTGAVRHMFSHHILKPERVPLEANVWGTPRSSGAFSTLFASRILKAIDYASDPFELYPHRDRGKRTASKVYRLSQPICVDAADDYATFKNSGARLYLSCGDSSDTDLAAESVDAVITDPPFFANVHYSELADFFYVWQDHVLGRKEARTISTRSPLEVQTADVDMFVRRLRAVFTECHRVLKANGLLAFTYHHSRPDGWQAVLDAVVGSGFSIVAGHPIKAEMSVAQPKHQAKEPIDLDIILVCKKRTATRPGAVDFNAVLASSTAVAARQLARFGAVSRHLSRNDMLVVVHAQIIARLSEYSAQDVSQILNVHVEKIRTVAEDLYRGFV